MAINVEDMIRRRQEDQAQFDRYMQPYFDRLTRGEISQEEYDRAKSYYLSPSDGYPLAQDRYFIPEVKPPIMYRPQDDFAQVGQPRMMDIPFARRDRPVPTAPERTVPELGAVPKPELTFGGLLGPDGVLVNAISDVAKKVAEKRGGTAVRIEDRPLNEPMRIVPGEGPPQERLQRMPSNLTLGQARDMARNRPDVAMTGELGMRRAANEYDVMVSPELSQAMERNNIRQEDINEARSALSTNYGTMEHFKKLMRPEVAFGLALAFNNMRAFPNAQAGQYYAQQLQDIQNQKLANQRMRNRSQWFEDRGRPDLAQLVRTGGEEGFNQAMSMYTQNPEEKFREFTAEEYKAIGHDPIKGGRIQVSTTTGKKQGGPYSAKAPSTNITVGAGESEFAKKFGGGTAEQSLELIKTARKAPRRIADLYSLSEALIDPSFETGPGASLENSLNKVKAFAKRVASRFYDADGVYTGVDSETGEAITEAALINAALGSEVFGAIGELGIGARGLDTAAERDFLREVMTGTIDMTPAALLYLAYLRQKVMKASIEDYNAQFDNEVLGANLTQYGYNRMEMPELPIPEFKTYADATKYLNEERNRRFGGDRVKKEGTITKDGIEYEIEEVR